MGKCIVIDYDKCVGCRTCEMVCSLGHCHAVSPSESRIRVHKWEDTVHSIPVNCRQCDDAPCERICPMGAISRDIDLECQVIDSQKCIGCRSCVLVCPFGAMAFNSVTRKIFKCDLCGGDPLCVAFCAYGTLAFTDIGEMNLDRMGQSAEQTFKVQLQSDKKME